MELYNEMKNNFFIMVGPNVIESEEHCLMMYYLKICRLLIMILIMLH